MADAIEFLQLSTIFKVCQQCFSQMIIFMMAGRSIRRLQHLIEGCSKPDSPVRLNY
jgi:hypothetical protein